MPYKCTACDKSFRYKVSQRTHKCLAQPPGTVVRQTGDLLQKLIQSSVFNNNSSIENEVDNKIVQSHDEDSNNIELIKLSNNDSYVNQALDEFVVESCNKMGIGQNETIFDQNIDEPQQPQQQQIHSPSDKFQNLCLYSPLSDDVFTNSLETFNEATFKELLYDDNNIL